MNPVLAGSLAGFTATTPMTLVMDTVVPRLPEPQRYPVYPALVTEGMAHQVGLDADLKDEWLSRAAVLSHFGYGTAAGAAFGLVGPRLPLPAGLRGAAFGLAVFAASYLGWLPALGVLPPATRYPRGRLFLLLGAHVVWGAAADLLLETLRDPSRATPHP